MINGVRWRKTKSLKFETFIFSQQAAMVSKEYSDGIPTAHLIRDLSGEPHLPTGQRHAHYAPIVAPLQPQSRSPVAQKGQAPKNACSHYI